MTEPHACHFEVPGPFGVKGSTFSFVDRRGMLRTKTDSRYGRQFAQAVQRAAMAAGITLIPKGQAVVLSVLYGFIRPKRCTRAWPCVRPDLDKLDRALLDALTGLAYQDDGQVVALTSRKLYTDRLSARVLVLPVRAGDIEWGDHDHAYGIHERG